MKTLTICVILMLVGTCSTKVFQRCEWARVLQGYGMEEDTGYSLADWVCLSEWESHYDTQATNHDTDGSTDYGIFQLNSRFWCEDFHTPGSINVCGIQCSDLLTDDISIAIRCAKRVVQDPNGIAAWVAWRRHCQYQDLKPYVEDCGL